MGEITGGKLATPVTAAGRLNIVGMGNADYIVT